MEMKECVLSIDVTLAGRPISKGTTIKKPDYKIELWNNGVVAIQNFPVSDGILVPLAHVLYLRG